MRKSFEGLSALVEAAFPGKLLTGALFLFLNRRRNLIKVLNWEGDGFAIWYKRLETGNVPGRVSKAMAAEPAAVRDASRRDRAEALKSPIFFVKSSSFCFIETAIYAIFPAC